MATILSRPQYVKTMNETVLEPYVASASIAMMFTMQQF